MIFRRLTGVRVLATIWRKTLKHVTFSNGMTIPPGVFLSAAATATHLDERLHTNATVFDPWRFVGLDNARSFVSTTPDFIAFGQGKHAWWVPHCIYLFEKLTAMLVAPDVTSRRLK